MTIQARTLGPGEIDHERLWSLLMLTVGLSAALTLTTFGLPPVDCAFKAITGWPCLTCGATRAFLALVQGHVRESLALHPLVVPAVLGAAVYAPYGLAVSALDRPRLRVLLSARDRLVIRVAVVTTAVVVWSYLIAIGR